ncbi:MAG: AMP-binding protein [Clostridia bacterium]|nr:AMP-binding protein [Clostridia bacterium]
MLEHCTPWPEDFAKLYCEKGYWTDITLSEMLESTIRKHGSKESLVYEEQRITYRELGEKVDRLAAHFLECGLKPLDRVVFQLPNIPEFVYCFMALVKIGVIPVMALAAHRQHEIKHFIKGAGAVGYFIPGVYRKFDYTEMAEEIKAENSQLKCVFVAGETKSDQISLAKLLETPAGNQSPDYLSKFLPDPSEVALMLLSGGTTGLSKLIPRTHNDYVYNSIQCGKVSGFNEKTVLLAILPLAHNYNLACPGILATYAHGGKVVIAPGIDPESIFPLVEREKVTIIPAAVPLISNWLNSPIPDQYNLTSLQVIQNGGAMLAPELRKRIKEKYKCTTQEVFGTAEGLLNLTRLDDEEYLILNSSGAPISPHDEIKVVDDVGNEVPDGEKGELICRGPYTIRGYYNNPEANAKSFTPDGFYRTGDVVRKRNGYLFTEGRIKDLINRGGEKISCEEVENLILQYPKVQNVCLVAMPDEVYGERACAWIIPKVGEKITFEEVIGFLKEQNIAKFKLPERIEVVDEFPLSPAGKILRRTLRKQIAAIIEKERHAKIGICLKNPIPVSPWM